MVQIDTGQPAWNHRAKSIDRPRKQKIDVLSFQILRGQHRIVRDDPDLPSVAIDLPDLDQDADAGVPAQKLRHAVEGQGFGALNINFKDVDGGEPFGGDQVVETDEIDLHDASLLGRSIDSMIALVAIAEEQLARAGAI